MRTRGERLYETVIHDSEVTAFVSHFAGDFGRLRGVTVDPGGEFLYLTTSNTDGRGEPRDGDDRIVRIPLSAFE